MKFQDILLTGTGHRDRRLNRDSPANGRSNLNQNLKPKPKSNFRFIRERPLVSFGETSVWKRTRAKTLVPKLHRGWPKKIRPFFYTWQRVHCQTNYLSIDSLSNPHFASGGRACGNPTSYWTSRNASRVSRTSDNSSISPDCPSPTIDLYVVQKTALVSDLCCNKGVVMWKTCSFFHGKLFIRQFLTNPCCLNCLNCKLHVPVWSLSLVCERGWRVATSIQQKLKDGTKKTYI